MDAAVVGGCLPTGLDDVADDLTALDARGPGRSAVILPFDGAAGTAR